jgi:transcriptional antiterminator NusG
MLMVRNNEVTEAALALANQEWGPPQSLEGHLGGLIERPDADITVRQWFVLQCEPQRERTAAAHLIGRRFKVFLPTETKRQSRSVHTAFGTRKIKVNVTKPIFPGYLFARLNFQADQARLKFIHNAPGIRAGIHSFLCVNERPAVIADQVMAAVEKCSEECSKPKKAEASFKVGQGVKVVDGPFASFEARVTQIMKLEPEERITALVDIFGRETPVEFDASQLRSL